MKKTILIIVLVLILSHTGESKTISKNGNLSSEIIINEIFPNPAGKDSKKEWVELYNASTKPVNLGNWKIKNITLSDNQIISPKEFLSIPLSLNNNQDEIKLLDFNGTIIDSIKYKESKENLALSLCIIKNNNNFQKLWIWTSPSKNQNNPSFYELNGKISSALQIHKNFFFMLENELGEKFKIIINENKYKFSNLNQILKKDLEISILGKKLNNTTFLLEDYKLKSQIKNEIIQKSLTPKWTYYLLIPIFLLSGILIIKRP